MRLRTPCLHPTFPGWRAHADRSYRQVVKTHLNTAGEGFEPSPSDARTTIEVDAAHTFTGHPLSARFPAFSLTDAMGRLLRDVVQRHGMTVGERPS